MPGPHSVVRIADEDGRHFLVVAANGCPLAKLQHCAEDGANAALFAAASELLEALRGARSLMAAMHAAAADRIDISNDPRWLGVGAAIAKATGGAS